MFVCIKKIWSTKLNMASVDHRLSYTFGCFLSFSITQYFLRVKVLPFCKILAQWCLIFYPVYFSRSFIMKFSYTVLFNKCVGGFILLKKLSLPNTFFFVSIESIFEVSQWNLVYFCFVMILIHFVYLNSQTHIQPEFDEWVKKFK